MPDPPMPMKCTRRPVKRLAERDSVRSSWTNDDMGGGILHLEYLKSILVIKE